MLKIANEREHFYQWDTDQALIVGDKSVQEVHFCNKTDTCSLVVEVYEKDGLRLANVPNILLQTSWDIRAYAFTDTFTKLEKRFKVQTRTKPADYVYTETECKRWEDIEERVQHLENENKAIEERVQHLENEKVLIVTNTDLTVEEIGKIIDKCIYNNCLLLLSFDDNFRNVCTRVYFTGGKNNPKLYLNFNYITINSGGIFTVNRYRYRVETAEKVHTAFTIQL